MAASRFLHSSRMSYGARAARGALLVVVAGLLASASSPGYAASATPKPPGIVLHVSAFIDGLSDLVIEPGGIHWEHWKGSRPGTESDKKVATEPTLVNDQRWLPKWRDKRSDTLRVGQLPRSFAGATCLIAPSEARCPVEVLQLSARRIVVRFYDTTSGADDYKVEIRIAPVDRLAYEPALSAAHQAIRMRDLALAKRAFSRALMQLPKDDTRQEGEDALYADVMARAVALCEAASFDGAKLLLALARKLEPKSADVAALTRWLGTAAKPMLVEDFRDPKLRKWSAEGGSWRVEDGRLVCLMPSITGNLFLAKARLQDVVLTFDVENGPREVGFRLGAYVRHGLRQHVSFAMSTQFGGLGPGARKGAKGITFTSATKRKIVAESGRRYHVAIRCLGQDIDCYVDDELLARGRDEAPAKGRIGLYAHRADAIFDNVRLYRPMPLPKVSIQTPPAGQ